MDFLTAIKTCFKKYITFSGRASRAEYWYFALFNFIGSSVTGILDHAIFHIPSSETQPLNTIFSLIMLLPCVAVATRRLHDVNRSGWWQLIAITIIGIIFPLLIWVTRKGTAGPNAYGVDPLGETASQDKSWPSV